MVRLGVNIDHVAGLRQARGGVEPEPVYAACIAEAAGADGITIHLREDRRHINDRDLAFLKKVVQTRINLEMALTDEMLGIAEEFKPESVCLVPERREEITTEGGLQIADRVPLFKEGIARLKDAGIKISLFLDADPAQMPLAVETGADCVEIHTGPYAGAPERDRETELIRVAESARLGHGLGLEMHAGHGLNYHNVLPVASLPEIVEVNIGHSIVSRAVFTGLSRAVREMVELVRLAREAANG